MSRKFISLIALLAMLVGAVVYPVNATQGQQSTRDQALIADLQRFTNGDVKLSYHRETGKVRFLGTTQANPVARPTTLAANANPETTARAYLQQFGPLFGITNPATQVAVMQQSTRADGRSKVRFQQVFNGVPVVAGELNVNLNARGELLSISGEVLPALNLRSTTPKVSAADAQELARTQVAATYEVDGAVFDVTAPELVIYNPSLLGAPKAAISRLAWRVDVENFAHGEPVREYVILDAEFGNTLLQFNRIAHAKERHICDSNNVPDPDGNENTDCALPTQYDRSEGQGPVSSQEVNLAYDFSGDTYDYFLAQFNRDSIDDAGMALISVVNYCPDAANCPYENAFWNGSQMTYGEGFAAAQDVVGHELAHGVTEYTSNLLYYYQSGAINEAMSDIFGEFMDLTDPAGDDSAGVRWIMGEELGGIRYMKDPTLLGQPDRMLSPLYVLDPTQADNGGVHSNSGVANKAAYLLADGDTFNGQTISSIGITKTGQIFYETQINHLTSGSDYADLADAMRQSCSDLINSHGITAADCDEVNDAIVATEMDLMPTNAPAPDIEACAVGQTPANLFYDSFELPVNPNWSTSAVSGGTNNWTSWSLWFSYATAGASQAENSNNNYFLPAQSENSALAMASNVTVPTTATAFVHFNHAYDFDNLTEGGVLEYSTNNGATWQDAGSLVSFNGYNGYIDNDSHALDGRQAFTGISNGYNATRLNISSLAGQSVRFRFHLGADSVSRPRYFAWDIDEFRVYTCSGPNVPTAPTAVTSGNVSVEQGTGPVTATVATVSDAEQTAATLDIDLSGAPAGLTITYTNTNGLITVYTECACDVPVGTYPITLTVSDSTNANDTTVFNVEVTPAGQVVADPGFEQGTTAWTAYSSSFDDSMPPLCNTAACLGEPRTGSGWLRFGARSGNADVTEVEQTITTPAGDATLEFYIYMFEHNGRGEADFLRLLVDGTEVFRATDATTAYDSGYTKVSIPLPGLTAGTHVIRFESESGAQGLTDIVRFSVDDLTIVTDDNRCRVALNFLFMPFVRK